MQRVEEQQGAGAGQAVATAARAAATEEFFLDTGVDGSAAAAMDTAADDDDEEQDADEEEEEEQAESDEDEDDTDEKDPSPPSRPVRNRKPVARADGMIDPTSPGLSFATPKSPSRTKSPKSGKRKAAETMEDRDLSGKTAAKEAGGGSKKGRKTRSKKK